MTHVLTTGRLELRPVCALDQGDLHAHWTAPEVRRFLFDGAVLPSDEVAEVIEESERDFAASGYGLWIVRERGGGDGLVGTVGLRPLEELGLEVHYSLAPEVWGRGYATEAARAVLDHALLTLGLGEVLAEVDEGNTASVAIVERLGMTPFETVPGELGLMTRYRLSGKTDLVRQARNAPLADHGRALSRETLTERTWPASATAVVQHTKHVVIDVGAAFGSDPLYRARGQHLGLSRWPFYFGGRAGVLGDVDAEVVVAACGFFAPELVREAWSTARATTSLASIVQADVEECVRWARTVYGSVPGLERLADLAEQVVEAAEPAGRPLFAAWRSHAVPADDPAARVALALLRLREHRGGSHLIAALAGGLTPLTAILAGPGKVKAEANGWRPPWPAIPASAKAALDSVEQLTDELAAAPYASLAPRERAELVELLDQVNEAYQRFRH